MSKKKILLEYNEKAFNELVQKQDAVAGQLAPLINYCQDTLQIEVADLKSFLADPKKYCVEAYWEKYGGQYKNAPVQKEKLLNLTAWSDGIADTHITEARKAFVGIGRANFEITGTEVSFKRDPEDFKVYVSEDDVEMHERITEFIEMAEKLQELGGKPAWTLANFHPALAAPSNELIHSKIYFTSTPEKREKGLSGFFS